MKSQSIIAAVAIAALTPSIASADEGLFIAASVGSADLSESFDGFAVDTDSTAYRVAVGWRFNDYLAVDAGYHNFGRFDQTFDVAGTLTDVSLKADGFTLGGIGSLPLSDRVSLFARAGAFFWDGDAEINNVTAARPEDTNFYFGAGVRFGLTDRLSGAVDGSRYELDGTSSTVLSVGLNFGF
jgi:OOP family OmpA-OmpF porin